MQIKIHLAMVLTLCCISNGVAQTQSRVLISPNKKMQKITLHGGDMERSSGALISAADPQQVANWAFKDINFNVCRVQFDKHQEMEEGKPNFGFYEKQVAAMKLVQEANPEVEFFATQRSDYHGYKQGNHNNFPDWIYDLEVKQFNAKKHGRFLADYVIYMHEQGVPIRYLSTGKEITQVLNAPLVVETIHVMNDLLDEKGVARPLMVEPGAWSLPQAIKFINRIQELGAENLFHAYASHNYKNHGEDRWREFVETAHRAGAEAWNTEANIGHADFFAKESAFKISLDKMTRRFGKYRAGIQGEIFFELWSRGIARETRAIYFKRGEQAQRMRKYYLMKQWTNSVAESTIVKSTVAKMPEVDALAFKRDQYVYVWLTNSNSEAETVPIRLSKVDLKNEKIPVKWWSEQTSIEGDRRVISPIGKKTLEIELAPESITVARFEIE